MATIQAPTTFDEPGQASHTVGTGIAPADASIVAAVADWRSVWESRDIGAFVGLYHPQAHTAQLDLGNRTVSQRGFTKARLTARAQSLFGAYSHIKVNIDNLSVERDGDLIVSSFDEDFVGWRAEPGSSPDFVDRGRHTLVYARDAHNEWRIVSEQWRPMAR
ncbi:DUF4440 domain-containing protein [Candidatus Poribacteria bacterium]|nr:DUF4440 domain-containing protein [Candidatus Poribacteria bacterium]